MLCQLLVFCISTLDLAFIKDAELVNDHRMLFFVNKKIYGVYSAQIVFPQAF